MLGKRIINTAVAGVTPSACTTDTVQILGDTSLVAYYKMSDATDETGSYDGTPTNVNFNVAGKFGNAGEFNGSSSYISASNPFLGFSGSLFSVSNRSFFPRLYPLKRKKAAIRRYKEEMKRKRKSGYSLGNLILLRYSCWMI